MYNVTFAESIVLIIMVWILLMILLQAVLRKGVWTGYLIGGAIWSVFTVWYVGYR